MNDKHQGSQDGRRDRTLAIFVTRHLQERKPRLYLWDVSDAVLSLWLIHNARDLLKRHVAGHDARDDYDRPRKTASARLGRAAKACTACAELHVRCDERQPCGRCSKKQVECVYTGSFQQHEAAAQDLLSLSRGHNETRLPTLGVSDLPDLEPPNFGQENVEAPEAVLVASAERPSAPTTACDDGGAHELTGLIEPTTLAELDRTILDSSMPTFTEVGETFMLAGRSSGDWAPRNVFDLGQNTNLELSDLDLGFLHDYNYQNPFVLSVPSPEASQLARGSIASNPPSALGTESLQGVSTWRFRPVTQDSFSSEQYNLSLPPTEANKKLNVAYSRITEPLTHNMRDRILAIIISSCRGPNLPRALLCFPSLELMDSLVQFYLTSKSTLFNGLLHLPSLQTSAFRPELLAAMIAAGASQTPDSSLQKVGFAIQEALRTSIPQLIEENNTLIADLQCLQSAGICLDIGLWSGKSRKMELAESFLYPYVTMARRRGWFLCSVYDGMLLSIAEHDDHLEMQWRAWIEQESRKRLVFFFFLHATRQSISLFTNPLISYAELRLPLPAPRELWLASSAEEWKASRHRFSACTIKSISLVDVLNDVGLLADYQASFDRSLATELLISAAWGLVWEYRQMHSTVSGQATQWNHSSLVLPSRLAELLKLLDLIQISGATSPTFDLYISLLRMHLHVPLEDIHLLAGAEGHKEACRVYPQLEIWASYTNAREAVLHAARIVAAARNFDQGCLRDFWAIVVYQAGLTLWSYGVISNAIGPGSAVLDAQSRLEDIVMLEEAGTSITQRFIALNHGIAVISTSKAPQNENNARGSWILLSEPGTVMGELIDLLRRNHQSQKALPPLVANLTELMEGLRAAVTSPPFREVT